MDQPLMGAVGVDAARAEQTVVAMRAVVAPLLAEVASVIRSAARSAALDDEASAASHRVDIAAESITELAGFISSQTSAALVADAGPIGVEPPEVPAGAALEGVAVYLDQYLQTGSAHLFDDHIGPNAVFAREIFADAVANGFLVEREGWFQPASCGDECHSPYSNPASRELLGIENMIEAEAMAEGQLDMIAGVSGVATVQLMRGLFRKLGMEVPADFPGSSVAAGFRDQDVSRGLSPLGGVIEQVSTNSAGGRVFTSSGAINQDDFAGIVNSGLMRGDDVHIFTGAHGLPDGSLVPDGALLADDVARFGGIAGVQVHDLPSLSSVQTREILDGPGTIIGGFCDSGACLAPLRGGGST